MKYLKWVGLLIIYVIIHDPNGDSARAYEGLSANTVAQLLTAEGKSYSFATKADFDAFVAAEQ